MNRGSPIGVTGPPRDINPLAKETGYDIDIVVSFPFDAFMSDRDEYEFS